MGSSTAESGRGWSARFDALLASGRLPRADLVQAFDKISRRTDGAVAGDLAELRHAQALLDKGAVEPGTVIRLGAKNAPGVPIELGPNDVVTFGGPGLPKEADLLFRAGPDTLALHEVKRSAHTLLEKVKKSAAEGREYLRELQRAAKTPNMIATLVVEDGAQFWEKMFALVGDMTLGKRLLEESKDVKLLIGGRAVTAKEIVRAMRAIEDRFDVHGAGRSFGQFVAGDFPTFSDWSIQ